MDAGEARLALVGGFAEARWVDTRGHPDDARVAALNLALETGGAMADAIYEAGRAAGRAEAFGEVGGQLRL